MEDLLEAPPTNGLCSAQFKFNRSSNIGSGHRVGNPKKSEQKVAPRGAMPRESKAEILQLPENVNEDEIKCVTKMSKF